MRPYLLALVALGGCLVPLSASAAESPGVKMVQRALNSGKLKEGAGELTELLKKSPKDDDARFALGIVQFLQSVEHLSQSLYRFGLKSEMGIGEMLPVLRLPVDRNPDPNEVSYDDLRKMAQTFLDDLARSETTLAAVKSTEVKVAINFASIRLDLNGDGVVDEKEELWRIYSKLAMRGASNQFPHPPELFVAFDAGDVHWLRGYCHLLSAFLEASLAYDAQELFNCTAHLVFEKPKSPFKFLRTGKSPFGAMGSGIADVITAIHLLRFPVKEPKRMAVAREHLKAMIRESRESWALILAETDDDREWIPSPRQENCVIPNMHVSQEMVDQWQKFLNEFEQLLDGKLLIPFWRATNVDQGVNLKRVFTEPTRFDAVLWVQGTAAAPYLEDGQISDPKFWLRLNQSFRGNFVGFGFWFN